MLEVIEILEDGSAVVCTKGLYRIRMINTGEVIDEFVTKPEVQPIIELWQQTGGGIEVEAVSYAPTQCS